MAARTTAQGLLQTKFAVPAGPSARVARPRLLEMLDAGTRGPLTLLAAPAGAGKTALVSAWIADGRAPGPVAWLSLDADDAEPARAWAAVEEALDRVERPAVLVLDDFQEADDAGEMALERLLRPHARAPRVIICTRADPSIGLGRLRAEGAVTELRAADLAFTLDEAAALMRGLDLHLTDLDLLSLWRRTEGWAAGLRLAALSLEGHPEPGRFVATFAGTDATVSDYLVSEFLARQPPELRDFLLQTSIVDVLNDELADAITGAANGRSALARLERDGTLLTQVDASGASGAWHRYHPLLAELLRARLRSEAGTGTEDLHRRAAHWLAARGDEARALRHAAAGGDWALTAELVCARWMHLLTRGETTALRPVLDAIPRGYVGAYPELALAVGGLLLESGDEAGAERHLRAAEERVAHVPPARRARFAAAMAAMRLHAGRVRGEPAAALAAARSLLGRQAVLDGEQASPDVRGLALANLGIVELWTGDLDGADADLEAARAAAREGDLDWLVLLASAHLAVLAMFRSEFARANSRADEAIALAQRHGWTGTWPAGAAFAVAAGLRMQAGDNTEADALLSSAEEALGDTRERPLRAMLAFSRAILIADRGRSAEALDVLRAGRAQLGTWPLLAQMVEMMASLEGLLLGATGERDAAHETLEDAGRDGSSLPVATTQARLALLEGDPAAARETLAPYLEDGEGEMDYYLADAWVIDARALEAMAAPDAAARSLERALELAADGNLSRLIVMHGRAVRPLLQRHMRTATAHGALVSAALASIDDPDGDRPVPILLAEPLSEREQAILRYLPTMMSNQEIAGELFVSVNTVKTHLKAIYRKLDATGRRDAVQRARELALIA